MRLQTLFCALAILSGAFLISCDKNEDNEPETEKTPTNFAEISLTHIKAVETAMSSNPITVSDGNNIYWETGDVFVYKTGEGRYGKFEVQKLTRLPITKSPLKLPIMPPMALFFWQPTASTYAALTFVTWILLPKQARPQPTIFTGTG